MRFYTIFVFIVLGTIHCTILAQTKKTAIVVDSYQQALQLYAENNFKDCIIKLERVEKLSLKANAKVLYLKTKALYQVYQTDTSYFRAFEKAFSTFMDVAPKQNYAPLKIQEIAGFQPQIQLINEVKKKEVEKLITVRDSVKADSTKKAIAFAIYTKAVLLYKENKFAESFEFLVDNNTLITEIDINIIYLKIKILYPIFTKSSKYQIALRSAFSQFNEYVKIQDFPLEKKQEIADIEQRYMEKVKQIEDTKARKAELTRMYQIAEHLYEEDKLSDCLTLLDQAETLIGTPDAKFLYLKVKILYNLFQKDILYRNALDKNISLFMITANQQNYEAVKTREIAELQKQFIASVNSEKMAIERNKEQEIITKENNKKIYEEQIKLLEVDLQRAKGKIGGGRFLTVVGVLTSIGYVAYAISVFSVKAENSSVPLPSSAEYVIAGLGSIVPIAVFAGGSKVKRKGRAILEEVEQKKLLLKNKYLSLAPQFQFQQGQAHYGLALRLRF